MHYNAHIKSTLKRDLNFRTWLRVNRGLMSTFQLVENLTQANNKSDDFEYCGMVLERIDACKYFLWYDTSSEAPDYKVTFDDMD